MLQRVQLNRLKYAAALTLASLLIGLAGFMGIEHFNLADAFYMSVITVSPGGYEQLRPLSEAGRIFTGCYILYNLLVVAYFVSVITTFIFDGELRRLFNMYRTDQEIKRFSGHVIICGFGSNGRKAYQRLLLNSVRVVVIELNEQLLKELTEGRNGADVDGDGVAGGKIFSVLGDATMDPVLEQAGVARASAIIAALPNDSDNMSVALSARALNPRLNIIARASHKVSERKLIAAGANSVVMPDEIGGSQMADLVVRPEVIRFLDMISGLSADKLRLEELSYEQMRQDLRGRSIRELDIRSLTGATVIGLRQQNGALLVSPDANYNLEPGDIILVLGSETQIEAFEVRYRQL
ncbi:potassium channel protein [Hymenobacter sp. BRD128]|uniref:potassium channel family protein n=1 Tax=Hymenobacter sp. BRD128 TaxID=2675878 RepID=UPI0015679E67|nr:potassium channel protein [Hymenobacter sp. BRD128]QKG56235.1 potassium channel protein [Hymenobacter sp. BRD128]